MNTQHLDEIARGPAMRMPRRHLLRGLGGGAVAAALTRFGREAVGAKPKKKCKQRKQIGQKCKLNNGATCKCRGGAQCKGGICTCPNGTTENLGVCVPGTCTVNQLSCSDADSCCSGHCGVIHGYVTCCVPNDDSCAQAGDCWRGTSTQAACEDGRCCREAGAICDAVDSPFPVAKCCQGTFCSSETYRCEPV